jgi:hypothetical protein
MMMSKSESEREQKHMSVAEMKHPYRGLPDYMFWKSAISAQDVESVDPVTATKFDISSNDAVAAAGSCFAQYIARELSDRGFNYLVTEERDHPDEPLFSARFGNIYTVLQLHQLLLRAYGLHRPEDSAWKLKSGKFIDPFRPQMLSEGLASAEQVRVARTTHLAAVRQMFEKCNVFVFTLGLTECWVASDGSALPLHPGVMAVETDGSDYRFNNFTVAEMLTSMRAFLSDARAINPSLRVILTVSPVPMIATYETRHVLISNTYSKSALRVIAGEIATEHDFVEYFPSYEIIMSLANGQYFMPDLRTISEKGVARVMRSFAQHFLSAQKSVPRTESANSPVEHLRLARTEAQDEFLRIQSKLYNVICDEDLIERDI